MVYECNELIGELRVKKDHCMVGGSYVVQFQLVMNLLIKCHSSCSHSNPAQCKILYSADAFAI